ncbi:MAG: SpoIIIAH-like family protein, partial [Lachnospiraceae bacterium]|nr:SpoIIIAH-like family protein [Lachnospiraceae bacterium]
MKTIFKKNQIIITALAIMIAVVGYLNFAKDKGDEADKEAAMLKASQNELKDKEGDEEFGDLSAEDLGEDYNFIYGVSDNGDLVLKENLAAQGDNVTASGNGTDDKNKDGAQGGENGTDGKTEDGADGKSGDKADGKSDGKDGGNDSDKSGAEVTGTPKKDGDASRETDDNTP